MKDINLMPEETKTGPVPKAELLKSSKIPVKAIIISLTVLLIMAASLITPKIYVKTLESYTGTIKAEIESPKYDEVKQVNTDLAAVQATISTKKDVINKINNNQEQITDIINYVQQSIPQGVTIDGLEYADRQLSVTGVAKSSTSIAEYISNLTRLNAFANYSANATLNYDKANTKLKYKLEFTQTSQGE